MKIGEPLFNMALVVALQVHLRPTRNIVKLDCIVSADNAGVKGSRCPRLILANFDLISGVELLLGDKISNHFTISFASLRLFSLYAIQMMTLRELFLSHFRTLKLTHSVVPC